ncbi:MAG: HDIG domain-containing protein [Acidobacteria bacterium]|nr:HDIG domain-containing protein [Acidobacteriota bacterium]
MEHPARKESVTRSIARRIEEWTSRVPLQLRLGITLAFFIVSCSLIISRFPLGTMASYKVGDVAKTDIITPVELTVIDPERTTRLREDESAKVPQVFIYYPGRQEEATHLLRGDFAAGRTRFLNQLETALGTRAPQPAQLATVAYRRLVESAHGTDYPFPLTEALARNWALGGTAEEIEVLLISALRGAMSRYVRPDDTSASVVAGVGQPVRLLPPVFLEEAVSLAGIEAYPVVRFADILPLEESRAGLRKALELTELQTYGRYMEGLVRANVQFAEGLTAELHARQTQHITASNHYDPRQMIVRRGEQITPRALSAIEKLKSFRATDRSFSRLSGLLLVASAFFFALWRFALRIKVFSLSSLKIFFLAGFTATMQLLIARWGLEISTALAHRFGDYDTAAGYQFAIPVGTGALILALLLESRTALVTALLTSLMVLLLSDSPTFAAYTALSSVAAIYSVNRYQRRDAITRAGLIVGLTNVAATFAFSLLSLEPMTLSTVLFNAACGLGGGLLTGAVASFALPITESAFGIVTDVKLLELSNVDLPLLKRLAIEAPGTYQHSFIVATLAEAAAKAVRANSLLVRIGCYYHDIGKLVDPQMYVENQRQQFNHHDLLTPRESVRMIAMHVTEGIRLGHESGLPQQIIDLIPQHHGTRRLHYFFAKAQRLAEATGETLNESEFRYPGPKPQSIEAAIVMLADSAEAATRSLKDFSAEHINRMLRKVIDSIVTDGQLDNCNLRMRDLQIIKQTFQDTLLNVHHQRIQYPGFTEKDLDLMQHDYEAVATTEPSSGYWYPASTPGPPHDR